MANFIFINWVLLILNRVYLLDSRSIRIWFCFIKVFHQWVRSDHSGKVVAQCDLRSSKLRGLQICNLCVVIYLQKENYNLPYKEVDEGVLSQVLCFNKNVQYGWVGIMPDRWFILRENFSCLQTVEENDLVILLICQTYSTNNTVPQTLFQSILR